MDPPMHGRCRHLDRWRRRRPRQANKRQGDISGTLCAKIAGTVAAEAAAQANTSKDALMVYDTRWRSEIGRELETGLRIREGFNKLSDDDLNYIIRALDDQHMLDIISKYR